MGYAMGFRVYGVRFTVYGLGFRYLLSRATYQSFGISAPLPRFDKRAEVNGPLVWAAQADPKP